MKGAAIAGAGPAAEAEGAAAIEAAAAETTEAAEVMVGAAAGRTGAGAAHQILGTPDHPGHPASQGHQAVRDAAEAEPIILHPLQGTRMPTVDSGNEPTITIDHF